ncbi:hypothetical protein OG474_43500 [Kribbella sp. NBC_01505]|uniref:RNA polymerase sigma factor n=1 Tax=Kribbella sp. NBC_01505 TaxID=2903580 RepID=UPI0038694536
MYPTTHRRHASPPRSEAALLASARRGDNAAAGQIYDQHAAALLQIACAILRDSDQSEKVVADVIVQVCTGADDPGEQASLRHQLSRLTYLLCVQRLPTTAQPGDPAEDHHDNAFAAMIMLRELARQQRAAIALVTLGDHTVVDVARLLRLPPARVLALLPSCLGDLRPTDDLPDQDRPPLVRRRHSSWALSDLR